MRRSVGCLFVVFTVLAASASASQLPAAAGTDSETAARPADAGATLSADLADVPPLVTDRPDFTESAPVVRRGILQIETGVTLEASGPRRGLTAPLSLLRLGIGRRTELRIGGEGLLRQWEPGGAAVTGHSDLEVGFKAHLIDEAAHGFDFSIIPSVSVPIHDVHFSSESYDPTVKFVIGRSLPRDWSFGTNINVGSYADADGRLFQSALSATVGHALRADFTGYAEVFGFLPAGRGEGAQWTANAGVSHPIGPRMQWDAEVGRTVGGTGWFMGAGFAVRTPR